MATTPTSLSRELECAICSDQLKHPKYIGACNHTFCKDCINQLWVSRGRTATVPCPQCRKECPIPSSGVSGLKDNFMVANIIETYRNQQQRDPHLAEIKCTLCPNQAACFCKDCDIKLCPECKRQHNRDPKTRDHDLFGLCRSHGSGLLFFCNPCKKAACGGCKISDHSEGDHDVTSICPVIINLISRIQASSNDLEGAVMTCVKEQENKLLRLCDNVQQKSSSAERNSTAVPENAIAKKGKDILDHQAKSQAIQKQIDFLVKEKENEDERTKQLINDVRKLEEEKTKIIAEVREIFADSSEAINLRLRSLATRRKKVMKKIEQGRAVGSTKITIDTESIADLTSTSQELVDLVNASMEMESDTDTVIEKVTGSIGDLGVDIDDMGQGHAVMSGDHQITSIHGIGKTKRVFRQLEKVCNVTFPRDNPCEMIFRLKHLPLPDSRVATLGTRQSVLADKIYFLDEVSFALTDQITEGVFPARDMAVSSTGEVVVARPQIPPIRVLKPATAEYRDINISHGGKVIGELWRVETDESDNMFVLTGIMNSLLLVVKPNGDVIQGVQLRGDAYYMAFCSLKRILYIAADDKILMFHWMNNTLTEISSSSHGVEGFHCRNVSIGSGGEVLVGGLIGNTNIVIHQVTEEEDGKDLVLRKIEYQDSVKRESFLVPHICISDDNLWLGYEGKIEKFKLV